MLWCAIWSIVVLLLVFRVRAGAHRHGQKSKGCAGWGRRVFTSGGGGGGAIESQNTGGGVREKGITRHHYHY